MDLNEMTRSDFEALPHRGWNKDIGVFDSMVIMPAEINWHQELKYSLIQLLQSKFEWFNSWYLPDGLHDSGYRCMDFVACKKGEPICRLSGCSDVIHFNGIGGREEDQAVSWNIDCLKESGFLHVFTYNAQLEAGHALSGFDLIGKVKDHKRR